MAENTKTQTSATTTQLNNVSSNSSEAPACSIPGCVHHIEGMTTSDKITYKYRTHFMNKQQVYDHAGESMQRVVAYKARTGKAIPVGENGAIIDIDHTGAVCETYDNLAAKLRAMSIDDRRAYEKSLQMQLDALKRAQSTSHSDAKTS